MSDSAFVRPLTLPELKAEHAAAERERLIEVVHARCVREKHRDRSYTPSSWFVCVECTPFVKILQGELS